VRRRECQVVTFAGGRHSDCAAENMGIRMPARKSQTPTKVRNRAAREQALISAASKLFASRGYEATTTREIALQAGCAEGLIHRYFRGKAGLLFALIKFKVSHALTKMNSELPPAPELEQEITNLVEFELKRMWEDREFFRVVIPCAICDPSIGKASRNIGPNRRARDIGSRLTRSLEADRRLSNNDIESIAYFVTVMGFMFGFMHPSVLADGRSRSRDLAMSITETFVRGLAANPPQ
jgi:TetR/AcrR family transcriptional regulator, regulator of cefoperazone and chloramphenicol sensitivity